MADRYTRQGQCNGDGEKFWYTCCISTTVDRIVTWKNDISVFDDMERVILISRSLSDLDPRFCTSVMWVMQPVMGAIWLFPVQATLNDRSRCFCFLVYLMTLSELHQLWGNDWLIYKSYNHLKHSSNSMYRLRHSSSG